jgi:UDP-glucose 4-epimerase
MARQQEKLNVLITGASTSIGRHLVLHLASDKKIGSILAVARHEKPYFFNDLPPDSFTYKTCDILKHRELNDLLYSRAFKNANINTVVHLAFHSGVTRGQKVHQLNVKGTKTLLEKCIENGNIKKFIFKSSDVVYKLAPDNPVFLDENADLNFDPDADQWIKDRVDADMICRSLMDNKKMNIVILRMSNIIGRNIAGQLNAYFDSKPIFKTMGFNPLINLLHMKDVIQSIRLAIHGRTCRGIYNIGGVDTAPISTIADLAGSRIVSLPEPMLPVVNWFQRKMQLTKYYYSVDKDRQKYTCLLDISKAKKELGYQPEGRVEF